MNQTDKDSKLYKDIQTATMKIMCAFFQWLNWFWLIVAVFIQFSYLINKLERKRGAHQFYIAYAMVSSSVAVIDWFSDVRSMAFLLEFLLNTAHSS